MHTAILFYQYVRIDDPEKLREREKAVLDVLGMTGRMIIAHEGVNATLEGTSEAVASYIAHLRRDKRFKYTDIKETEGTGSLFPRLRVKVRPEIVTTHLPEAIDPTSDTGVHLAPEELRKWYEEGKDFEIIDMRNDYEFDVGHFKGSHRSGMAHFRDIKDVPEKFAALKSKPVLTVCTGGVRCEKASAYLKSQGFTDVYQLHGGMHRYMEKFPGKDFLGTLYTFDGRVTMDFGGEREIVGTCALCGAKSETYANCIDDACDAHFIACDACRRGEMRVACPLHASIHSVV